MREGPLELRQKLVKKREKRKNIAEKQKARIEKLTRRNPRRLWSQIQELESKEASLSPNDQKILANLKRDLRDIQKFNLSNWKPNQESRTIDIEPKDSIYYHPIINPSGAPPPGFKPHAMDEFDSPDTDESTAEIPLPPDPEKPVPVAKSIYESEPVLRVAVTDLKPRTI